MGSTRFGFDVTVRVASSDLDFAFVAVGCVGAVVVVAGGCAVSLKFGAGVVGLSASPSPVTQVLGFVFVLRVSVCFCYCCFRSCTRCCFLLA